MTDLDDARLSKPSEATRRSMVANSGRESLLEVALRKELHARGLRFRKHLEVPPKSRCRPDVVFTRARVAVFVDGCFWHRCPIHGTSPDRNGEWWRRKLDVNEARDRRNDASLETAGWTVLRFWEHQSLQEMATAIEQLVRP